MQKSNEKEMRKYEEWSLRKNTDTVVKGLKENMVFQLPVPIYIKLQICYILTVINQTGFIY